MTTETKNLPKPKVKQPLKPPPTIVPMTHESNAYAIERSPESTAGQEFSRIVMRQDSEMGALNLPEHKTARGLRQTDVLHNQQRHGNASTQRLITQRQQLGKGNNGHLQLHPEGADMSIDPTTVATEVSQPARQETPATPAAVDTPATPTTAPPVPASPQAMSMRQAEKVLQDSFGTVHKIVPGNIVLLDDRAAVWAKYDEVCIRLGCTNNKATPPRPWQNGDAQVVSPGLEGFADSGIVYVNKQTPLITATAHEMLHNNTAAGFRGAVGETINEGSTEYLAIKALNAAGVATPGSATAYPGQVAIVTKLIKLVGEGTLTAAYFGGADTLIDAYDTLQGSKAFSLLKPAAEALNTAVTDLLLTPPSVEQKIAIVNSLLDGWVSDTDLDHIEMVVNSASGDKAAIATAIQPRIKELWSIGQRTRLRVILGTV